MLNTIYKRKSIRTYTGDNISEDQLNVILKAASYLKAALLKMLSRKLFFISLVLYVFLVAI